jgi:hypothetical protein
VTLRRTPRIAAALLRIFAGARYGDDLEGDLLEEWAAGRSTWWYWRQVLHALGEHAGFIVRQQIITCLAAAVFFFGALWVIAPLTYPVMDWARATEPLRVFVLLAWLAGVPVILGGVAGAAERSRRVGAILIGAAFAYLTPVTSPLNFAVCDLCASPAGSAASASMLYLTSAGSALFAGLGAWAVRKLRPNFQEKIR